MTVQELIDKLITCDPNSVVTFMDSEGNSMEDIHCAIIGVLEIKVSNKKVRNGVYVVGDKED